MGRKSGGAGGKKRKNVVKHKLKRSAGSKKGGKGSSGSGKGKGSGKGRAGKKGQSKGRRPERDAAPAEEAAGAGAPAAGTQAKGASGRKRGAKGGGKRGAKGGAKGSGPKAVLVRKAGGQPTVDDRGKGRGKGGRGHFRKVDEEGKPLARKRRAPEGSSAEGGGDEDKSKKKKKMLTAKQKRKKEVTKLYSELINPGRKRKPAEIVESILQMLKQRDEPLAKDCLRLVGSKVVQACLKWGSRQQRREVLTMLKADIPELVLDHYGHAVVLKLLRYTTHTAAERAPTAEESTARSQNLKDLLESLNGKTLHTTFFHRYGCRVINAIYFSDALKAPRKRQLLHEVAVPASLALTRPELKGGRTLRQILVPGLLPESSREALLAHLQKAIERAVNKELLGIDIVHVLLQAFCEVATEQQLRDFADKSMGGAAYLLSSKPGAEALIYLLGVANAKQRRAFCKDLKGKCVALATNSVDYVVMMRLCSTVDDTVLLAKSVLTEWIPELSQICFDKYGSRVLAWLLGADSSGFTAYERGLLALPAPTSLKAAETRRVELLRALRPPLRVALLAKPLEAAADSFAKDVLIAYLAGGWDEELAEALVAAAEAEADKDDEFGVLCSGEACIAALTALLGLDAAEVRSTLAEPLWHRVFQPRLLKAIRGTGVFLLLRLVQSCAGKELSTAVRSALNERRGEVEAALAAKGAGDKTAKAARKLMDAEEAEKEMEKPAP